MTSKPNVLENENQIITDPRMTNKPNLSENPNQIIIDPRMLSSHYNSDDEISLVDLWLSLVKQKNILFLTTFIIVALTVLYIFLIPDTYTYKTDISIGTQGQGQGQGQLIQSPEAILANLDNAIIPKILRQQHQQSPENKLEVSASIPKKTDSVLLSSKGTNEQKKAITELHQQVISILAEAHRKKVLHTLSYLNDELISSQSMLAKLTEQSKSNPNTYEQITMQVINLENNIRMTKRNVALFTDTKSAMGTIQSIKPTNIDSKLILAASIVIGLFMGIFTALFANFLAGIKEEK